MDEEEDEAFLDEQCALKLNALLKTFDMRSRSVEVCNIHRHTSPGFMFVHDLNYEFDEYFETREQITEAVNAYITKRQQARHDANT